MKDVYGLKEAPRLWYLRARQLITQCGWEELRTAKATFVVRNPEGSLAGMMVLHFDDACLAGVEPAYDKAVALLRKRLNTGSESTGAFEFLGRHVKQNTDGSIEVDQHAYVRTLISVYILQRIEQQNP